MEQRAHPDDAKSCPSCGALAVRSYRRWAGGPAIVLAGASLVGAIAGIIASRPALVLGGLVAIVMLPRLGGVRWWGGSRCTRCGYTEMLR